MRVLVTGAGCICALGAGSEVVRTALYDGQVPPGSLCRLDSDLSSRPLARRVPPGAERALPDADHLSRTSRMALYGAREAALEAGLLPADEELAARIGVAVGSTTGTTFNNEDFYRRYRAGDTIEDDAVARYLRNDPAAVIASSLGFGGPRLTITTACAAGTDAIGIAARWIATGRAEIALAGGADELSRFTYLGFASLKNSSDEPCRPFDRRRKGLNLGEGAAFLMLESEQSATQRGRHALAEIVGFGSAGDAHHITAPHPEGRGLRKAIEQALADAGVGPDDVAFVNAHGTGTLENDRVEGTVISGIFGRSTPVVATKGATGHTLGGAGALEALFTAWSLRDGFLPPTLGCEEPDPDCLVAPSPRGTILDGARTCAVSTSLAFGGGNSVLVLRRPEGGGAC